jgi:MraZ protein
MEKNGDALGTGKFELTLDEKGRIIFPSKLRAGLSDPALIVTQSMDKCLWLFTEREWQSLRDKVVESTSPFNAQNRLVLRRLIGPAQRIEFDKSDRLSIPQSLRKYAALSRDCVILGLPKYIELWDEAVYSEYLESSEPSYWEATEGLRDIHF